MGRAARANPVAQAAKSGHIKPKPKRPVRAWTAAQMPRVLEALLGHQTRKKKAATRTPLERTTP